MGSVTIKVDGLRQLGEAFATLDADIQGKVARATTGAMAQVIRKDAAKRAPVAKEDYIVRSKRGDPGVKVPKGNLGNKVSVKFLGKNSDLTSEHIVFVKGKRKDGYANRIGVFNEFGTIKDAPKPFMRPALDSNIDKAIAAGAARLKARIDKAKA